MELVRDKEDLTAERDNIRRYLKRMTSFCHFRQVEVREKVTRRNQPKKQQQLQEATTAHPQLQQQERNRRRVNYC